MPLPCRVRSCGAGLRHGREARPSPWRLRARCPARRISHSSRMGSVFATMKSTNPMRHPSPRHLLPAPSRNMTAPENVLPDARRCCRSRGDAPQPHILTPTEAEGHDHVTPPASAVRSLPAMSILLTRKFPARCASGFRRSGTTVAGSWKDLLPVQLLFLCCRKKDRQRTWSVVDSKIPRLLLIRPGASHRPTPDCPALDVRQGVGVLLFLR